MTDWRFTSRRVRQCHFVAWNRARGPLRAAGSRTPVQKTLGLRTVERKVLVLLMDSSLISRLNLPPIDQVAWVVNDLDHALETFGPLFGDFQVMTSKLRGCNYRGRSADLVLKMAFGRSGPLEIELIQVLAGEGPHREMLDKYGEGVHHVRFKLDDISQPLAELGKLGFEVIWSHQLPEYGARWAYLEGPAEQGGALVELYELRG